MNRPVRDTSLVAYREQTESVSYLTYATQEPNDGTILLV